MPEDQVCHDLDDRPYRAVLVIGEHASWESYGGPGGGCRIVQRLDGMNWLHRRIKTGARHYLRAEFGNWLLRVIRARLAAQIIYQSNFACGWWEKSAGAVQKPSQVIYNGVDLQVFQPQGHEEPPSDKIRILLVEGSLMGGYEAGLKHAFQLAAGLAWQPCFAHSHFGGIEIQIVGSVPENVQRYWEAWAKLMKVIKK
jgi:glycosyltransferase involved in cell wall biosynthesis